MSTDTETTRHGLYWRFNRFLERHLPERLYPRSLIIVIAPMVLLQTFTAGVFMERHWSEVTKRLSRAVVREMAFITAVYEHSAKTPQAMTEIEALANKHLRIGLKIHNHAELPPPVPKPLFSLLDIKLTKYLAKRVGKPFWIDTIGKTGFVDIRIEVEPGLVFRFLTDQDRAYASNTYIFLLWMAGSACLLLWLAVVFLRNQIKPILHLAEAAQAFGMGRNVDNFEPRGAREVQDAAQAFINMKTRIERHVDQRTAMLAGVSHDLRTMLTRFKLELEFFGDQPEVTHMKQDVLEMQGMLEGYMAFARGDGGENNAPTDIAAMLNEIHSTLTRSGHSLTINAPQTLIASVKPNAFKRCIVNLLTNALRHGQQVEVKAWLKTSYLSVSVDDNGPGLDESQHENVFRPFVRLDNARNLDEAGTGLGLAIALDIAHSHGGRITLGKSHLGGLAAVIRIPV